MKRCLVAALMLLPLGVASPALAQDPIANAYGGSGGVSNEVAPAPRPAAPTPVVQIVTTPPTAPVAAVPGIAPAEPAAPVGGQGEVAGQGENAGQGNVVDIATQGRSDHPAQARRGDQASVLSGPSLPFTGLDVALMLLAGGALLAMGAGMRRLSRVPV